MASKLYPRLGVSSPFDPLDKLVTSPWFSPTVLAWIRLVLASYSLFVSLFILIWEAVVTKDAATYFSYFTDLSYIGVVAYFWAAGVQTLVFSRARTDAFPLQKWPRPLQFLHVLLFTTITTFPIVVTVVFWSLLADAETFSSPYEAWSNISHHALNTVFILFEIFLTSMPPFPWLHLPMTIVILALYLGVAYITHSTQGFYTYSFLDPQKEHGFLAAYIVGIAIAQCVVFVIVRYVIVLRDRLAPRKAVDDSPPTPEAIDEWQDVDRPSTTEADAEAEACAA